MSRRAVFRSRIIPKSVLYEQPYEPASTFIDRVGRIFYDNDWTEKDRAKLNHNDHTFRAGSEADLASTVRNQLLSGLQNGVIKAFVFIIAPALQQARIPPSLLNENGTLEDEDLEAPEEDIAPDPLWREDGSPKLRRFYIESHYWSTAVEDIKIDWLEAKITISIEYLRDESWMPRRNLRVDEVYNLSKIQTNVPVYINCPHKTLSELVKYEDVPGQEWLDRYKIYREKGRAEVPAVMWRYIAIGGFHKNNPPSAMELSRAAMEYLTGQGFGSPVDKAHSNVRNAALEEMAHSIIQQLVEGNLSASVLVSGNPRKRRGV